jgi:hypothetical protein
MSLDNQLQILANEFVKEAQSMATAIYFENPEKALSKLDDLVKMATDLHRAVTSWNSRFDDGESA